MTVTHTTSVFAESPVGPVGDESAVERWLNEGGRDVRPNENASGEAWAVQSASDAIARETGSPADEGGEAGHEQ